MGVAQLVERWIVVPVAVGSNPTTHPNRWLYADNGGKPESDGSTPTTGGICGSLVNTIGEGWFQPRNQSVASVTAEEILQPPRFVIGINDFRLLAVMNSATSR